MEQKRLVYTKDECVGCNRCIGVCPCPAVVGYIEKYIPELLPKLMPVHSPMMCGAIYAKKYMKVEESLAFISPCVAKKNEIDDPNCGGYISYNVTFDHLIKYLKENPIVGTPVKDEIEYGLGSIYPMPGGLKENVYWLLGEDAFIRQMEGEKHMYHYLEQNKELIAKDKTPYLFVDALNCSGGCIYGTGIQEENVDNEEIFMAIQRIKKDSKKNKKGDAWSKNATPEKRLKALNKQFKTLELNDFIRHYTDKSAKCVKRIPTAAEEQEIFRAMMKETEEKQSVNCSGCGYDTCKDVVCAIFNGFNHKENCVYYSRDLAIKEKEENEELFNRINEQKKITDNMKNEVVGKINESFDDLEHTIDAIEAARAGESGKGFAVVADEIKILAENSKHMADDSNRSNSEIKELVNQLFEKIEELTGVVNNVNDRTQNLAASAEETTASINVVAETIDGVKEQLKQMLDN